MWLLVGSWFENNVSDADTQSIGVDYLVGYWISTGVIQRWFHTTDTSRKSKLFGIHQLLITKVSTIAKKLVFGNLILWLIQLQIYIKWGAYFMNNFRVLSYDWWMKIIRRMGRCLIVRGWGKFTEDRTRELFPVTRDRPRPRAWGFDWHSLISAEVAGRI